MAKDLPLHAAATSGDARTVQLLLRAGAQVGETQKRGGATALHLAALHGRAEACDVLLSAGADPNQLWQEPDASPFMLAVQSGNLTTLEAMLRYGAKIDPPENRLGGFPLLGAAEAGWADCVDLLIRSGAQVERCNRGGVFPLLAAAERGHVDAVRHLLEAGARVDRVNPANGTFPLLSAARDNHLAAMKVLLEAGADPDLESPRNGTFPLLIAAVEGHARIVVELVERGATPNKRHRKTGATALDLARARKHDETAKMLAMAMGITFAFTADAYRASQAAERAKVAAAWAVPSLPARPGEAAARPKWVGDLQDVLRQAGVDPGDADQVEPSRVGPLGEDGKFESFAATFVRKSDDRQTPLLVRWIQTDRLPPVVVAPGLDMAAVVRSLHTAGLSIDPHDVDRAGRWLELLFLARPTPLSVIRQTGRLPLMAPETVERIGQREADWRRWRVERNSQGAALTLAWVDENGTLVRGDVQLSADESAARIEGRPEVLARSLPWVLPRPMPRPGHAPQALWRPALHAR